MAFRSYFRLAFPLRGHSVSSICALSISTVSPGEATSSFLYRYLFYSIFFLAPSVALFFRIGPLGPAERRASFPDPDGVSAVSASLYTYQMQRATRKCATAHDARAMLANGSRIVRASTPPHRRLSPLGVSVRRAYAPIPPAYLRSRIATYPYRIAVVQISASNVAGINIVYEDLMSGREGNRWHTGRYRRIPRAVGVGGWRYRCRVYPTCANRVFARTSGPFTPPVKYFNPFAQFYLNLIACPNFSIHPEDNNVYPQTSVCEHFWCSMW